MIQKALQQFRDCDFKATFSITIYKYNMVTININITCGNKYKDKIVTKTFQEFKSVRMLYCKMSVFFYLYTSSVIISFVFTRLNCIFLVLFMFKFPQQLLIFGFRKKNNTKESKLYYFVLIGCLETK